MKHTTTAESKLSLEEGPSNLTYLYEDEDRVEESSEEEESSDILVDECIDRELLEYSQHYHPVREQLQCYSYFLTLFTGMLCFGSTYPAVCFLVLIIIFLEIKLYSRKLLRVFHRVYPYKADSIGPWTSVLQLAVRLAVITNAAIVAFAMEQFSSWRVEYRLCLFIGFVLVVGLVRVGLKNMMGYNIKEVAAIQRQRRDVIVTKLFHKAADQLGEAQLNML
jgi:hypothetical protein